jgi:glycine cleavage system protein P-like pyridoxal-binding family
MELTSVMIIKKYYQSLGQKRNVILIPIRPTAQTGLCGNVRL